MIPNYTANVDLEFGRLGPVVRWCEQHLERDWTFEPTGVELDLTTYTFKFEDERDAVKFIMWQQ